MAAAETEARLRDSELSRLRAWEQLQRLRAVLEALCGRRVPQPAGRDFEAEGDALVGALYEEVSALLEDLGRLEAFFGQLRPVIGQALAEEEAESLRLSMLDHLPQRPPLRLGEVRLRLERAWRSGALPPGIESRPFAYRRPVTPHQEGAAEGVGEGTLSPQELPLAGAQGPPPRREGQVKAPKQPKGRAARVAEPDPIRQTTFAWD